MVVSGKIINNKKKPFQMVEIWTALLHYYRTGWEYFDRTFYQRLENAMLCIQANVLQKPDKFYNFISGRKLCSVKVRKFCFDAFKMKYLTKFLNELLFEILLSTEVEASNQWRGKKKRTRNCWMKSLERIISMLRKTLNF